MSNRIRRGGLAIAVVVMALAGAGRAQAGPTAYASAVGGNLFSVDLSTGSATLIGNTGINLVEGLALSSNGTLFATDDSGTLYTLNKSTGAIASTIGSTGLGDVEGLSFMGNTLVGSNFTGSATSFFSLNTSTAASALLSTTSPGVGVVRALTVTGGSTADFLAGTTGSESLYSVNLTTGATTTLGPINPTSGFAVALGAGPGGTLYSLDSLGFSYTVSNTGAYTQTGSTGNNFFLDMAIIPTAVPEPSSLALCGIAGMIGLAVARARRKPAVA